MHEALSKAQKLLNRNTQNLSPGYFAMVMATGAVSLAAQSLGMLFIAQALFWLNVIFYFFLWFLTGWRGIQFTKKMRADFTNHLRGPGFLTMVAGTAILGAQCLLLENQKMMALILGFFSVFIWLLLNYGLFISFIVQRSKPALEKNVSGIWLLFVVAILSIAMLAALLEAPSLLVQRLEGNFIALSLWFLAGMFYIWIMVLIFYRLLFFDFFARDMGSSYWINMGVMALFALVGSQLLVNAKQSLFLHSMLSLIKGITLLFWAAGTWWIPLLLALGFWRYGVKKYPIRYESEHWALVFPIAIFSLGTLHMAKSMHLPFLIPLGRGFFFLALAAWSLTFLGMIYSGRREHRESS